MSNGAEVEVWKQEGKERRRMILLAVLFLLVFVGLIVYAVIDWYSLPKYYLDLKPLKIKIHGARRLVLVLAGLSAGISFLSFWRYAQKRKFMAEYGMDSLDSEPESSKDEDRLL